MAKVQRVHATHQPFGGLQRDGAHPAFADMLLHLANNIDGRGNVEALTGDADGRIDQGNVALGELTVHGGSGYLDDFADFVCVLLTLKTEPRMDTDAHR